MSKFKQKSGSAFGLKKMKLGTPQAIVATPPFAPGEKDTGQRV